MFLDEEGKNLYQYRGYELSKEEVMTALAGCTSVKEAARNSNISYPTLKKYAQMYVDEETGKTLFDKFKNQSGKGLKKNFDKLTANYYLEKVLRENQKPTPERVAKLKEIVVEKELLPLQCNRCGFNQKRLTDMRTPLMLNFKNKDKSNWKIDNLELVCYNCYFLYISDPFKKVVNKIEAFEFEDNHNQKKIDDFHQLDQVYLDHLKNLGLDDYGDISEEDDVIDYQEQDDEDDLVDRV